MVVVEQAAEPVAAAHQPVPQWWWKRDRAPLLHAPMRTGQIVVVDVLGQHAAQVGLAGDEQVIETLRAGRADPAFRVGVGIRRAVRRADDLDALRREDGVEGWRELGVAIVDQVAGRPSA